MIAEAPRLPGPLAEHTCMVTTGRTGLHLEAFGISSKHALRQLLTEFRHRGWRDPGGAAFLVISRIERQPGITADRAAAAAPSEFFDVNHIRKSDLARALREMAARR
jgi:hypothetical protein